MTAEAKSLETLRDDVRVGKIFLDDEYGRPPSESRVAKLVQEWDRARVGVVYLSLREDGKYAVIDGNHRVTACRIVEGEDAALPARVYIDLSQRDEAELFTAFNRDRAVPKPGEIFRARLTAGEPSALAIYKIVTDLGLDIAFDGQAHDQSIQAVATLDKVYAQYGGAVLREVLLTIRNTMGSNAGAIQGSIMRGLAAFLVRYGEVADRIRLFEILATNSPKQLLGIANSHRTVTPNLQAEAAVGMAITQLYNQGLKSKHLPPWQAKYLSPEVRAAFSARAAANPKFRRGTKANGSAA